MSDNDLATTDANIRSRTGRGWTEWFDLLDEWGAAQRSHRDIARHLADVQDADPLAWNVQAVVGSYERVRGLRAPGEKDDGYTITASKTVGVPVEQLYGAFTTPATRTRWLPDGELSERTATPPRSARYDWGDGRTRIHVTFTAKGDDDAKRAKSTVVISHERLADAAEGERMKAYWRDRITALKRLLEA